MNLRTLIELNLKSDEVVEVLEMFDLSVVYDFDRLNEGIPDMYWVSAHGAGFELRFDERQVLDTVFMYVLPREEFNPIEASIAGVPFYESLEEAKRAFEKLDGPYQESPDGRSWIKCNFASDTVHYEFNAERRLALVTVSGPDQVGFGA